jgi:integrase
MGQNYWGKWSDPLLVDYKGDLSKKWFVKLGWKPHGGELEHIQLRHKINRKATLKARTDYAKDFMRDLVEWLRDDWNPKTKAYKISEETPEQNWQNKLLDQALTDALQNIRPRVSKGTAKIYTQKVTNFNKVYHSLNLVIKVKDVKRSTVTTILSSMNLSNKNYNTYVTTIAPIFSEVEEKADLSFNPAHKIKRKLTVESEGFIPPTDEEQEEIKKAYANSRWPEAINPIETTYHTGIRYKEGLLLRIEDIKLADGMPYYKIVPDPVEENSKTKKIRWVPINEHEWNKLESMNLHLYNKEWFLYGKRGNKFFVPGPIPINREKLTNIWKKLVKKGLGFDCHMYGEKHKGANDKHEANISAKSIQFAFGHSSESMTNRYMKKAVRNKAAKEMWKSPEF